MSSATTNETVAEVLKQAPGDCTMEQAVEALQAANGDISTAIANLWGVNIMPTVPEEKPKSKWEQMRELCNDISRNAFEKIKRAKK